MSSRMPARRTAVAHGWSEIVMVVAGSAVLIRAGAHLPLDVVGEPGVGLAVAGAVRLLVGRPA